MANLYSYTEKTELFQLPTQFSNWFGWPHYKLYSPDPRQYPATGEVLTTGTFFVWLKLICSVQKLIGGKVMLLNAMADVNVIRTRAGAAPYTDAAKFDIGTILDERARELYWEEPRKDRVEPHRVHFRTNG
jgi:starch-binding outer membrane protein, SusD/RagB family